MGRRKKADIEEALSLTNEVSEEIEKEETETTPEEETPAEAKAETEEKVEEPVKKLRARRSRKKAPGLSIENAAEENATEEVVVQEDNEIQAEPIGTEIGNPPTPARGRGRSRRNTPDSEPDFKKDLVAAVTASQKSMTAVTAQWEAIQKITSQITTQLEKSSDTIKGLPESILDAHPELIKTPGLKSQHIAKFAIAASIVAVILSLLSLSLSQSARQAMLSNEVARKAQSMVTAKPAPMPSEEIAALPFERVTKKEKQSQVYGPELPRKFKTRR